MNILRRLIGFQRAGLALLLALLALTALGGIVRVTGSGLACPDWPGCYGAVIPTGDFGEFAAYQVWLEWSHRLAAAIIGLLILAYAVYAFRRQPRAVWLPAALAIPMLALQVILGGLTVTERLEALIVTLHLAAAMLIVMLIAASWLGAFNWPAVASEEADAPLGVSPPDQARTFARIALFAALLVYAAVVVGSYVTHVGADPDLAANVGPGGAACGNNWPFCYGGLWPEGIVRSVEHEPPTDRRRRRTDAAGRGAGRGHAPPPLTRPDHARPRRRHPVRGADRRRRGHDLDQLRRLGPRPPLVARLDHLERSLLRLRSYRRTVQVGCAQLRSPAPRARRRRVRATHDRAPPGRPAHTGAPQIDRGSASRGPAQSAAQLARGRPRLLGTDQTRHHRTPARHHCAHDGRRRRLARPRPDPAHPARLASSPLAAQTPSISGSTATSTP